MSTARVLPFEIEPQDVAQPPPAVAAALPEPLRSEAERAPHLFDYLQSLPLETLGVPSFHKGLSRAMGDMQHPNVVYPVGDGVYVHIRPDPGDARDWYVPIEPVGTAGVQRIMPVVENRLIDYVALLSTAETDEEKAATLDAVMDRICCVIPGRARRNQPSRASGNGGGPSFFGRLLFGQNGRIAVTSEELMAVKYALRRDKLGLGLLQPFIQDPYIEDISCSGVGSIFVEHKVFRALKGSVEFSSFEELDDFVLRLSERIGKPVTFRDPIVDAVLPDGSRVNVVYGRDVSKRGSNFTIRKFTETPMSILDLIETGSVNYELAAYLWMVIGEGMNIFVSGETASGKTTLLNAITSFIAPSAKIVSIEDTAELQVPHPNWLREVVRSSGKEAGKTGVGMFDLLKAALRQRPNEIIVGEIRGEEGAIAFQAMQTGHAVMATFHAATVEKLIQRLTGSPINIPKTYVDNLNLIVIQQAVRLPNGKMGRRVLGVNEIVGYDPPSDSFSYIEVFRWDPVEDKHEFVGRLNSFLLEQKVAQRRGLPPNKKRQIYAELDRRATALERVHKSGLTNFYDLFGFFSRASRRGVI